MVNTGKPSNACFECRRRRIKCDASRPECEKCIKHRVKCPGYPDKAGFRFREESTKVKKRAAKRYGKPQKQDTSSEDEKASCEAKGDEPETFGSSTETLVPSEEFNQPEVEEVKTSPLQQSERTLSVPHVSVGNALTQGAISAFMSQWSSPDPDLFWASFDGAALLYPTAHLSTCYISALEAVSLMTMSCGDKDHNTDLRRPAMKAYGRSLAMINKALEDPTQRTIDHTFMAIELIILFELLESGLHSEFVGPRYGTIGEFNLKVDRVLAHLRGIMAVVSIRGREQFSDSLGRRLFLTACVVWNLGSISMPEPMRIPLKPSVWENLFEYDLGTYSDTYRLLPLQDQAIAIRKEATEKFQTGLGLEDIVELLHAVQGVDNALATWHSKLPEQWTSRTDLYAVFTFNLYRSYRIFMQDLLVRCYHRMNELQSHSYDGETEAATTLTMNFLDEICASTPYTFAEDNPRSRVNSVAQPKVPKQGITVVSHLLFSFPLLVASMIEPVSEIQNRGIEEARLECARACGLTRPIISFPRTLLQGAEVAR